MRLRRHFTLVEASRSAASSAEEGFRRTAAAKNSCLSARIVMIRSRGWRRETKRRIRLPELKEDPVDFGRVITAMATPFRKDGSLDTDGAAALAQHLIAHGSDALVVAGTTGEAPTLTLEEKRDLWTAVAESIKGRAAMIAGTGI